jgi:rod shape-determining protein MreC
MRRAADPTARGNVPLVVGCTALAFIALLLPRTWGLAISAALRETALRPVVAMRARANAERTARFSLSQVQHERDSLAIMVQEQTALRRENATLRGEAGLRARIVHRTVSAEVLHRPTMTDSRMLLLDVGGSDGVQSFDPVVTADGLVGYVVSVAPHSSMTFTWDNPDFAAAAVSADGRVGGFVRPSERVTFAYPSLEMRGIALGDSIVVGTTVLTAGSGGTFPRGIPIGRVVAIDREVYGYDRVYRIAPFANPGDASHVVVLISPRDSAFPTPPPVIPVRSGTTPLPTPAKSDSNH